MGSFQNSFKTALEVHMSSRDRQNPFREPRYAPPKPSPEEAHRQAMQGRRWMLWAIIASVVIGGIVAFCLLYFVNLKHEKMSGTMQPHVEICFRSVDKPLNSIHYKLSTMAGKSDDSKVLNLELDDDNLAWSCGTIKAYSGVMKQVSFNPMEFEEMAVHYYDWGGTHPLEILDCEGDGYFCDVYLPPADPQMNYLIIETRGFEDRAPLSTLPKEFPE